ncbi:MAG: cytochrome c [Anaerolineales bacterium]|nr:cytochrome c [Anaerolineales bacterium]
MKKKYLLYLILVLSWVILWGCATTSSNANADVIGTLTPVPPDFAGQTNPFGEEAAVAGAAVFKNNCESCHGRQGHGDGPAGTALVPAPKNLALLQTMTGDDYLFWRISFGKDGTAMIAWKDVLTEEQIWQIIAFIRTLE